MPGSSTAARRLIDGLLLAATLAIGALVALASAMQVWLVFAVCIGGGALCVLMLYASPQLLLLWLAAQPLLSSWVDAVPVAGLPALTPDRMVLGALLGGFCVSGLIAPGRVLKPSPPERVMAVFLVLATCSLLFRGGTYFMGGEGGIYRDFMFLIQGFAVPFAGFLLARSLIQTERHRRQLLNTIVAIGGILAATGLVAQLTGFDLAAANRHGVIQADRMHGTVSDARTFGMLVTLACLAATVALFRTRSLVLRLLYGAILLMSPITLVFSKTRAVWLGLAVSLGILCIYQPRLRRQLIAGAIAGLLILIPAWAFFATDELRDRVVDISPLYARVILNATSLNAFIQNPVFGIGFGRYSFFEDQDEYIVSVGGIGEVWGLPGVPHNSHVHLLLLMGMMGFVPYVMIIFMVWKIARAELRDSLSSPASRDLALFFLAGFAMYLFNGLFGDLNTQETPTGNILYVVAGALAGAQARRALSIEAEVALGET